VRAEWAYLPPEVRLGLHATDDSFLLCILAARVDLKQGIQADVKVARILRAGLRQAPVGNLGIEDPIANDFKLPHEGARILAEVVEDLDDASVLEDLFEA